MSISTLGIIGSGQLGSLLCQAAKKLDVKTVVISDDKDGPAQNYSDEFIYSKYDNKDKIKEFLSKVDIITYEFENIPIDILKEVNNEKKVLPKPDVNEIVQNRKLEKTFVNNLGIKTTDWTFIKSAKDVQQNEANLRAKILKQNTEIRRLFKGENYNKILEQQVDTLIDAATTLALSGEVDEARALLNNMASYFPTNDKGNKVDCVDLYKDTHTTRHTHH